MDPYKIIYPDTPAIKRALDAVKQKEYELGLARDDLRQEVAAVQKRCPHAEWQKFFSREYSRCYHHHRDLGRQQQHDIYIGKRCAFCGKRELLNVAVATCLKCGEGEMCYDPKKDYADGHDRISVRACTNPKCDHEFHNT